jgi:phosphate transport system permease protein
MSTLTFDAGLPAPLSSRRLPRWALPATAAGAVALTALLFTITPLQGRADFGVVAIAVYLAAQTAVSIRVEGRRRARDRFMLAAVLGCFLAAMLPLFSVLVFTIAHGMHRFDSTFFTHSMRNIAESDAGGGAYHAIVGTLEQVGLATAIAVPFGLLVAVYLTEYARGAFGRLISFFVDVMTGIPSIVAGLFILAFWIQALHEGYSGFAGALALVVLMLPTVVRSAEEMFKLVPPSLREAGYALGLSKATVTLRVVLPTALPGIVTGVMLAIARITGETAPLLLTIFGTASIHNNPFHGFQSALPLFVFQEAGQPNNTALDRAWAGALTLILIVVALNLAARILVRVASRSRA